MRTLAVVIGLLIGTVVLAQTYRAGENWGYSQGWSDAHCGTGNSCESGQE
jgi:hypothetical protein